MGGGTEPSLQARALILFSGESCLRRTWALRRGFRHCATILERPGGWLFLNPLASGLIAVRMAAADHGDLAGAYRGLGWRVLSVRCSPRRRAGFRAGQKQSCVAFTKRAIGLQAPGVVTPLQLYRHLAS